MFSRATLLTAVLVLAGAAPAFGYGLSPGDEVPTGINANSIAPCQVLTPDRPETPSNKDAKFSQEEVESAVVLIKDAPGATFPHVGTGFTRIPGSKGCVGTKPGDTLNVPGTFRLVVTYTTVGSRGHECSDLYAGCLEWLRDPENSHETVKTTTFKVEGLPKRFDQESKDAFTKLSTRRGYQSSAYGAAAALACPFLGPAAIACGVVGSVVSLAALGESYVYGEWAKDPVDHAFRAIARPRAVSPPKVVAQPGISAGAAAALNALSANAAKQASQGQAMLTALNRAQGAHLKHRKDDERRQMKAARRTAGALVKLRTGEPALLRATVAALRSGGFPDVKVTAENIAEFRAQLLSDGLPASLKRGLASSGLSATAATGSLNELLSLDLSAMPASTSLLDSLTDPQTLAAIAASTAKLRAFARG